MIEQTDLWQDPLMNICRSTDAHNCLHYGSWELPLTNAPHHMTCTNGVAIDRKGSARTSVNSGWSRAQWHSLLSSIAGHRLMRGMPQ